MEPFDTTTIREQINRLKWEIDDRRRDLHDKIMRLREDAKLYERDASDRAYSEIEPLRLQMEAMIKSLSDYESLQAPPPLITVHQ